MPALIPDLTASQGAASRTANLNSSTKNDLGFSFKDSFAKESQQASETRSTGASQDEPSDRKSATERSVPERESVGIKEPSEVTDGDGAEASEVTDGDGAEASEKPHAEGGAQQADAGEERVSDSEALPVGVLLARHAAAPSGAMKTPNQVAPPGANAAGAVPLDAPHAGLSKLMAGLRSAVAGSEASAEVIAGASAKGMPEMTSVAAMPALGERLMSAKGSSFKLDTLPLAAMEAHASSEMSARLNEQSAAPLTATATAANGLTLSGFGEAGAGRAQFSATVTFGQPQWANMVAERSASLFAQNISQAEIQLDPPELGRMTVQVQIHNNDQASVTFSSANAGVRDALDQTGQRLRELLSEQGLDLVNVDVSDQQGSHESHDTDDEMIGGPVAATELEPADAESVGQPLTVNLGISHYV